MSESLLNFRTVEAMRGLQCRPFGGACIADQCAAWEWLPHTRSARVVSAGQALPHGYRERLESERVAPPAEPEFVEVDGERVCTRGTVVFRVEPLGFCAYLHPRLSSER